MHGVLDALVTAASADVARHRFADLVVGRLWIFRQQRGRLHRPSSCPDLRRPSKKFLNAGNG
jgi:hypothetical protein